jgi:type IV secretory pathway component VirB8
MKKPRIYTTEQYAEIATLIEDGSFFKEGRKWYSLIYMYIMPERAIYVVYSAIALLILLMALISTIMLNPLSRATPLLFPMKNVLGEVPRIKKIRVSPHQQVNDAMQRFFIREYVSRRESYDFKKIQTSFRFLRNHSNKNVMSDYRNLIDPNSPRSPINMYGRKSTRQIFIQKVQIGRSDNGSINDYDENREYYADTYFVASVVSGDSIKNNYWLSRLTFDYKQLQVKQPEETKSGKAEAVPMKFKVIDYSVMEVDEYEYLRDE